jgi:tetratricopeptide (TPR) repeat protein
MLNLKAILPLLLAAFFLHTARAQSGNTPFESEIRAAYYGDREDEVLSYVDRAKELGDSSLYRIGRTYFKREDMANALKFFDLTLKRNPRYQNAWYFRSIVHLSEQNFDEALSDVNRAIAIDASDPDYFYLKGDVFRALEKPDSALVVYKKATEFKNCPNDTWVMIAEVYAGLDRYDDAAKAFRASLPFAAQDSQRYQWRLYNTGLSEFLAGRPADAEKTLLDLLGRAPSDYAAIAKLIQVLYAQEKYKETKQWKDKLYEGWKAGKMPKRMKDDFCFDQFKWKNREVVAYEQFAEEGNLYYKHVFYVLDEAGKVDFQVQTEHSVALKMANAKYTMGMNRGNTHYTFMSFIFQEDVEYKVMKKAVLDILNEKVEPSSSSTFSRN